MTRSPAQDATGYPRFFELSSEMLATMDRHGRFTSVNAAFQQAAGATSTDLLARSIADLAHPEDRAATIDAVAELRAGTQVARFTNRCAGEDGTYRSFQWSLTADLADDRIYALVQDVTDARDKDEALRGLVFDLERSNEELSQFAYVASHDLSEPLRVVAGHVELLADRYRGRLDEDADRYIEFAVDGCGRMRRLIEDLLSFSRAGREGGAEADVDLNRVLDEATADLAELIAESGATIEVEVMPVVVGTPAQFNRIFANLLENALKFRRPGATPTITVSADRQDDGWQLTVRDDGIGIEPQYRERIFRIFQRLHGGDTYPGTGIGLAICRKMVELRGGEIWCVDGDGPGTTFRFTIPDRVGDLG